MNIDLSEYLSGQVFALFLIFCRIGSAITLLPGFGESYVPAKMRLLFALGLTLIVAPILAPNLPKAPGDFGALIVLMFSEILLGLFFGMVTRLIVMSLETAGVMVATQIGLSNASIFNPTLAQQGTLPSALYGATAVLLLFVTDTHHVLLAALVESYRLYPPGNPIPVAVLSDGILHVIADSFLLGLKLAAPFIVVGTVLFVVMGVMNKFMPTVQIFFISLPLQIALCLTLFAVTLPVVMTMWLQYLGDTLINLPAIFPSLGR